MNIRYVSFYNQCQLCYCRLSAITCLLKFKVEKAYCCSESNVLVRIYSVSVLDMLCFSAAVYLCLCKGLKAVPLMRCFNLASPELVRRWGTMAPAGPSHLKQLSLLYSECLAVLALLNCPLVWE